MEGQNDERQFRQVKQTSAGTGNCQRSYARNLNGESERLKSEAQPAEPYRRHVWPVSRLLGDGIMGVPVKRHGNAFLLNEQVLARMLLWPHAR